MKCLGCLDDVATLALLVSAAEYFARAETPDVTRSFMLATMTVFQKKDGGVWGKKPLARHSGWWPRQCSGGDHLCLFFQFAQSTGAGVDCVGHAVRGATDENPEATVLSIDGVGIRPCSQERDAGEAQGHTKSATSVAVRPIGVFEAVVLQVEGLHRSKEIPSCFCSSVWQFTMPSFGWKRACFLESFFLRSWMTCMWDNDRLWPVRFWPIRFWQIRFDVVVWCVVVCVVCVVFCAFSPPSAGPSRRGRRGFTRQPENSKRAHLTAPALPNTTKIPREDTQRKTKRAKMGAGEGKKRRKMLGGPADQHTLQHTPTPTSDRFHPKTTFIRPTLPPPPFGPPPVGPPTLLGPTFSGLAPHPSEPPPFGAAQKTLILAKNGLAKNGLSRVWSPTQAGLKWCAICWPKHFMNNCTRCWTIEDSNKFYEIAQAFARPRSPTKF